MIYHDLHMVAVSVAAHSFVCLLDKHVIGVRSDLIAQKQSGCKATREKSKTIPTQLLI